MPTGVNVRRKPKRAVLKSVRQSRSESRTNAQGTATIGNPTSKKANQTNEDNFSSKHDDSTHVGLPLPSPTQRLDPVSSARQTRSEYESVDPPSILISNESEPEICLEQTSPSQSTEAMNATLNPISDNLQPHVEVHPASSPASHEYGELPTPFSPAKYAGLDLDSDLEDTLTTTSFDVSTSETKSIFHPPPPLSAELAAFRDFCALEGHDIVTAAASAHADVLQHTSEQLKDLTLVFDRAMEGLFCRWQQRSGSNNDMTMPDPAVSIAGEPMVSRQVLLPPTPSSTRIPDLNVTGSFSCVDDEEVMLQQDTEMLWMVPAHEQQQQWYLGEFVMGGQQHQGWDDQGMLGGVGGWSC